MARSSRIDHGKGDRREEREEHDEEREEHTRPDTIRFAPDSPNHYPDKIPQGKDLGKVPEEEIGI